MDNLDSNQYSHLGLKETVTYNLAEFDIPGVDQRPRKLGWAELGRDVAAAGVIGHRLASEPPRDQIVDTARFLTEPTVLRRLAQAMAARISSSIDRVACGQGTDIGLGAAVSLASGLPFVIVGTGRIAGELHPGETIAFVLSDLAADEQQANSLVQQSEGQGATVETALCVIGPDEPANASDFNYPYQALFAFRDLLSQAGL